MAIWPFGRKKDDPSQLKVPAEVQQYYQAERRERVGLAWLLAAGTLVVTVLIGLALFFGGRALYRHFNKSSTKPPTATTQKPATQKPAPQTPAPSTSTPPPSNPTPPPTTPPQPTPTEVPRTGPDLDL